LSSLEVSGLLQLHPQTRRTQKLSDGGKAYEGDKIDRLNSAISPPNIDQHEL